MIITKISNSKIKEIDFENLSFGKYFSDHMFIMSFKNNEWLEPKIIPYGPLSLNPGTHVFHYGQAIFEGMKAFKNESGEIRLFRPIENLKRFNKSAKRLCMPEIDKSTFLHALKKLVKIDSKWIPKSCTKSLYIRPFMISESEYIRATPATEFKFMIITSPTSSYYMGETNLKIEQKYARSVAGVARIYSLSEIINGRIYRDLVHDFGIHLLSIFTNFFKACKNVDLSISGIHNLLDRCNHARIY